MEHEFSPDVFEEKTPLPKLFFSAKSIEALSHPDHNEDSFFVNKEYGLIGVFDGVGGMRGGQLASKEAAKIIQSELLQQESPEQAQKSIQSAIEMAHTKIQEGATTASVVKICKTENEAKAIIGNVGDSRVYLFRNNELIQATLDDSEIRNYGIEHAKIMQKKLSNITDIDRADQETRAAFASRNVVTQALGASEQIFVRLSEVDLKKNDILLCSTDGLTDNLTDNEIQKIISQYGADAVNKLIEAANKRRSDRHNPRHKDDDISAVLMQYDGPLPKVKQLEQPLEPGIAEKMRNQKDTFEPRRYPITQKPSSEGKRFPLRTKKWWQI